MPHLSPVSTETAYTIHHSRAHVLLHEPLVVMTAAVRYSDKQFITQHVGRLTSEQMSPSTVT